MSPEETTTQTEETSVSVEKETTGDEGDSSTKTDVSVEKTTEEKSEGPGDDDKYREATPERDVNVSIDQTINTPGTLKGDDPNKNTEAAQEPIDQ